MQELSLRMGRQSYTISPVDGHTGQSRRHVGMLEYRFQLHRAKMWDEWEDMASAAQSRHQPRAVIEGGGRGQRDRVTSQSGDGQPRRRLADRCVQLRVGI